MSNDTLLHAFAVAGMQLTKDGWLQSTPEGEKPAGVVQLRNPQDQGQEGPVMIASGLSQLGCGQ